MNGRIELSLDVGGRALLGEPVKPFSILLMVGAVHPARQNVERRTHTYHVPLSAVDRPGWLAQLGEGDPVGISLKCEDTSLRVVSPSAHLKVVVTLLQSCPGTVPTYCGRTGCEDAAAREQSENQSDIWSAQAIHCVAMVQKGKRHDNKTSCCRPYEFATAGDGAHAGGRR
jgi:hypothetical protein